MKNLAAYLIKNVNKGESLFKNRQLGKLFVLTAAEMKQFNTNKQFVVLCGEDEVILAIDRDTAIKNFCDWAR